jgi:hypothetical protein
MSCAPRSRETAFVEQPLEGSGRAGTHDQVHLAAGLVLADVEDADDARVIDATGGFSFSLNRSRAMRIS